MPYPFYNNYQNYNHVFYPQQYQNMQQSQQPIPQIQNGGFVMVKDISEAMAYPVAPGNSVTFKDESKPSNSEFIRVIKNKNVDDVFFAMDDMMEELQAVAPKLYYATMERLKRV